MLMPFVPKLSITLLTISTPGMIRVAFKTLRFNTDPGLGALLTSSLCARSHFDCVLRSKADAVVGNQYVPLGPLRRMIAHVPQRPTAEGTAQRRQSDMADVRGVDWAR